ncbi:hypothetical protein [Erwinia aphidicola]|uniref:hypothetical protein n=1 Tax=Erwinia aphidicola TaxID=68334 RepID=UPI0030178BDE
MRQKSVYETRVYSAGPNQYFIHYQTADGRAADRWFEEGELSPSMDVEKANSKEKEGPRLAEVVSSVISDRIRKELLPGGLLYSR